MDGKGPQQANPNRIIDDPLAPLRLAPVAQISDFWKRYDRLADIHDKKLTSNLNGNLDVLLIFAALFSAIDTTFISITMPNLSPNSSDETNNLLRLLVMRADNNTLTFSDLSPPFSPASNSIVVNCLLYASLSCSLLAAVGAMMAKEWLQSFDRTGQTGPLEDQGRLRQGKLNGVERWHLEAVIKFLPNLLLLSVILFFTGIGLFLYPINVAVAGIIIAFSGFGGVFSIIVIVAGAITTTCPYQSAASGGLRRIIWALLESWRILLRSIVRPAASTASERLSKFLTDIGQRIRPLWNKTNSVGRTMRWWSALPSGPSNSDNSEGDQVVSRDSPETSSSLYVPQPSGRSSQSDKQAPHQLWRQARGAPSFTRLQNTTSAIGDGSEHTLTADAARWLLEATSNYGDQISTAQFICSLPRVTCTYIFEDPDSWNRLFNMTMRAFEIWSSQPNKDNQYVAELFGLVLCRVLLQCPKGDDKWNDITNQSLQEPNSFCTAFLRILEHASGQYSLQEPEDEECILHTVVLSAALGGGLDIREFQWAKLSRLLGSRSHLADPLFAVWTAIVWRISKTVQTGKITRLSLTEVIEQLDSR
ncbi:hypothetical protein FRC04_006747 [Tulasnella sp. 424]|nr:hypothetical protein FRC04_006747 [Tulasnella sp. 424]KAG8974298.1 hypothetical protein FRC05_007604 [Tulasnella sp. 425]